MAPSPNVADFASFSELISQSSSEARKCIWYLTDKDRSCNNNVNKVDVAKALELAAAIRQAASDEDLLAQLKQYALLKCCKQARHGAKLADSGLHKPLAQRWLRELSSIPSPQSEPRHMVSNFDNSIAMRNEDTQSQTSSRMIQTRSRSQQASQAGTGEATEIVDPSSSLFRPRIVRSHQSISTKLRSPLKSISNTGTIYLFTRASSLDFVKIGFTKWAAPCRLREWERSCGYKPILLAAFDEVPHMQKVEQLIHFQLARAWRVEKWCVRCCKQHQEWFEIESKEAIDVAEQWIEWMREAEPYDAEGHLKTVWVNHLRDLEAKGIPVTAEVVLDIHLRSLIPESMPLSPIIEELEIPETQPDDQIVLDADVSTGTTIDLPIFTNELTAEPDGYSSHSSSQRSTTTLSHMHILTSYLSTMFMIIKVFAQLSPDVFRLLLESCTTSPVLGQSSVVSSTRQTSMISSGTQ